MRITSWGILGLAPDGVYKHSDLHQNLVVSYTTISPLPFDKLRASPKRIDGGIFSVALSIPTIYGVLPLEGILSCGARTFLSQ